MKCSDPIHRNDHGSAALTAEEQAYLSDYMESFSPEGLDPDDLASLFHAFAKGDTAAEGALTQFSSAAIWAA